MDNTPTGAPAPDPAASPVAPPPEPSLATEGPASSEASITLATPTSTTTQASSAVASNTQPASPSLPVSEVAAAAVAPQLDAPAQTETQAQGTNSASTTAIQTSSEPPVPSATTIAPAEPVVDVPMSEQPPRSDTATDAAKAAVKKPRTLVDLPVDILRLVVKEVTHTNDLAALARTHSVLYQLAVPHIYSRFDIVWPDPSIPATESKGVDALTYGLSTLCLGSAFARTAHRLRNDLYHTGCPDGGKRRKTNFGMADYAKHVRKFSLGNGPADWVAEYLITRESGKMLGTLVALCVAKMQNLETFIWDMPTGVVSDVFMALASLPDFDPEQGECKLERLWIRWHNHALAMAPDDRARVPPPATPTPTGAGAGAGAANPLGALLQAQNAVPYSTSRVEFPTFSVVPPLRGLSVLDIDELAYLDEMAVLIGRSQARLSELRVGIATHATREDFVQTWNGGDLRQVDLNAHWPGESKIGARRLGGVLGILLGRVLDLRKKAAKNTAKTTTGAEAEQEEKEEGTGEIQCDAKLRLTTLELERVPVSMQAMLRGIDWTVLTTLTVLSSPSYDGLWRQLRRLYRPTGTGTETAAASDQSHGSGTVPSWDAFGLAQSSTAAGAAGNTGKRRYRLALKSIHTDQVSKPLLQLIKETLAPQSLEVLFLQRRRRHDEHHTPHDHELPTIEEIFDYAIRPHRQRLRKLLVDGKVRRSHDGTLEPHTRHVAWTMPTRVLSYLSSGKMMKLQELAMSIKYADWHAFLQRLPNMAQLRSLNIQHLNDCSQEERSEDLAMQIANVVTLRSEEVQLNFVGIQGKCYEVYEAPVPWGPGGNGGNHSDDSDASSEGWGHASMLDTPSVHSSDADEGSANGDTLALSLDEAGNDDDGDGDGDEDGDEVDDDADEEEDDDAGDDEDAGDAGDAGGAGDTGNVGNAGADTGTGSGTVSDASDSDSADGVGGARRKPPHFRVREVYFYDEKVAIFKARHGRL